MNTRTQLIELLKLMVDGRAIDSWEAGYILGALDMANASKQIKKEGEDGRAD